MIIVSVSPFRLVVKTTPMQEGFLSDGQIPLFS